MSLQLFFFILDFCALACIVSAFLTAQKANWGVNFCLFFPTFLFFLFYFIFVFPCINLINIIYQISSLIMNLICLLLRVRVTK